MATGPLARNHWQNDQWSPVELKPSVFIEGLKIVAWAAMLVFVASGVMLLLTRKDSYGALMAIAGIVWMTAGFSVIRMRRVSEKKFIVTE